MSRRSVELAIVAPASNADREARLALVEKLAAEGELELLFADEDRLIKELRAVRTQLAAARCRYAAKHGLKVYPSYDTLRLEVRKAVRQ